MELVQRALADRDEIAFAAVFGSCARGAERATSDLDLAIQPAGPFSLRDEDAVVAAVERATGRSVDLVRLDRTDDVVLRNEIARGVAVRDAPRGAFAYFAAEAALAWLDLEPTYRAAQRAYLRRASGT